MQDFETTVKIELIKKGETIKLMAIKLGINYNYMYQVLKGQRNSEEIVGKVKEYLGLNDDAE